MPRNLRQGETQKRAASRREHALARRELGQPTAPRVSAAGPTSMAIKAQDPSDAFLIEAYLRKQKGNP